MPRLSVALPVYNGANYIREALDSILAQDFTDFELVISDNCSTDETPAILAEYAQRDTRIRVSRSDTFLPQVPNVRRAISLCSGEWIKLFCHDDLMKPGCLRIIDHVITEFGHDAVGLISNGETHLFENGFEYVPPVRAGAKPQRWQGREYIVNMLSGKPNLGLPALTTATVRKSAYEQFGGFDERFVHFDTFYWTILLSEWDLVTIPQPLTVIRVHGGQVAVSALKSLRTVQDHQVFWPEFIRMYSKVFKISKLAQYRLRLKPLAVIASLIALELLKRNYGQSLRILLKTPLYWWILLPLFVQRSFRREQLHVHAMSGKAPVTMIHP